MAPSSHRDRRSITTVPRSVVDDRRDRMIAYSVAMTIRVVCFLLVFVVPGWFKVIPALGAVLLPYFAVVIANVPGARSRALTAPEPRALSEHHRPAEPNADLKDDSPFSGGDSTDR